MFYDVILLNANLETEYRCKTTDFLWHSKFLEPGEFQIEILIEDDLDLDACKYVTVNTKKEIGILQKPHYSSDNPGTVILSGFFMEAELFESVIYPTYSAANKTIWQIGSEVCSTYLNNLGFPLILPSQPSSGVIAPESLSFAVQQTGDYVGTLLYDQAAVFGYGVSLTKVNKVAATNLVTNGDFSDGDTGWVAGNSTNTAASGILTNTGNGNSFSPNLWSALITGLVPGKKYYYKPKIRVTNSKCTRLAIYTNGASTTYKTAPIINAWYEFGLVFTAGGTINYNYINISHYYTSAEEANGMSVEIDRLLLINLTDTFGAGDEPTAAEMDALLSAFSDSWFDGTQWLPYAGAETRLEAAILNYHDRTGVTDDEEKVFSVGLNSIKKYDVVKDDSNYRNVAIVAGEGEGSARVFEIVDKAEAGEQKRHLWVDARDIQQETDESITDYRLKLRQRGLEKLAETVKIINVEIEIEDEEAQEIGTEYDIGDIVTVVISPLKLSYSMKIIEVEDVVSQGKRSTSLIFGDKIPTAWEKVKRFYR